MTEPSVDVGVIMGSVSDGDIAEKALEVLREFGVSYEVGIKSAHRTPEAMLDYAKNVQPRGIKVVIALAGGSAHLPGMVASETSVPVLAVPVRRFQKGHGDEARKSSIAMPPGIPLAVFPDNGADRAALFAIRILAANDERLSQAYEASRQAMTQAVLDQDSRIQQVGWEQFYSE